MSSASQLPGKGPTGVDDASAPAINKKSNYYILFYFFQVL